MTREEQWDKTARFYDRGDSLKFGAWYIGMVSRDTRWCRRGDVLVASQVNGAGRWAWTGVTSKGRRLHGFYMNLMDPLSGRPLVEVLQPPGELRDLPAADPGVRAFVLGWLRAA